MSSIRGAHATAALAACIWGICAHAGDWTFYRHDISGTSNAGEPLTADQARGFHVLWSAQHGGAIANPIVANGKLYVTGVDGSLHAMDPATGAQLWQLTAKAYGPFHCFPNSTPSTTRGPVGAPAIVGGTAFLPGGDGVVYAANANTGAILWQTKIADPHTTGDFLWSSAFPLNGRIYVGVASLHDCLLVPGRVVALDQATGQVAGTFWSDVDHQPGGGVWTQQAFDPATGRMFLTTGNIGPNLTPSQQPYAQAFVAIDPNTMQGLDSFQPDLGGYATDVDFGASPVLYDTPDGRHWIASANKDGWIYAMNRDNLAAGVQWSYQIAGYYGDPDVGGSTIVSPSYANGTLFVGGTRTADGAYAGTMAALDAATGQARWVVHPPDGGFILGAPTVTGDVVFFASTHPLSSSSGTLYVLSQATGEILYSLATPGSLFSEPTYANGILYVGDLAGNVWALQPGTGSGGGGGGGGTPTILFSDDFNRTTGLGSSWIVAAGAYTTNGSAALGTALHSYAFWAGTPPADVSVSAVIPPPNGTTYAGVLARAAPTSPDGWHYAGYVAPDGSLGIARRDAWSYTYLANGGAFPPGSHTLALQVTGTSPVTLTLFLDGAQVLSATDSSANALVAAGLAGMNDYNGASLPVDSFTVATPGSSGGGGGGGGTGTLFSDDFNRTGGLGASWLVASGAYSDNGSAAIGTALHSYAFWVGSPPADVSVSAVMPPPNGTTYAGVLARADATSPDGWHYAGYVAPDGTLGIARRDAWSYTYLANGGSFPSGSHTLKLKVSGSGPVNLTLYVDGAPVLTATDSSGSALAGPGLAGIFDYNGASLPIDSFQVSAP